MSKAHNLVFLNKIISDYICGCRNFIALVLTFCWVLLLTVSPNICLSATFGLSFVILYVLLLLSIFVNQILGSLLFIIYGSLATYMQYVALTAYQPHAYEYQNFEASYQFLTSIKFCPTNDNCPLYDFQILHYDNEYRLLLKTQTHSTTDGTIIPASLYLSPALTLYDNEQLNDNPQLFKQLQSNIIVMQKLQEHDSIPNELCNDCYRTFQKYWQTSKLLLDQEILSYDGNNTYSARQQRYHLVDSVQLANNETFQHPYLMRDELLDDYLLPVVTQGKFIYLNEYLGYNADNHNLHLKVQHSDINYQGKAFFSNKYNSLPNQQQLNTNFKYIVLPLIIFAFFPCFAHWHTTFAPPHCFDNLQDPKKDTRSIKYYFLPLFNVLTYLALKLIQYFFYS